MMKPRTRLSLLVLSAAILSFLCWYIEVHFIKGWDGLAWLSGSLNAAFFCTLFVVLAAMLPVLEGEKIRPLKIVLAFLLMYAVAITSFFLSQLGFNALRAIWVYGGSLVLLLFLVALLFTVVGFYLIVHQLLRPMRKLYLLYLLLAFFTCLGLSKLTILLFPAHGQTDFIHTIKAGYQQFWITITLALATFLGKANKTA